MLCGCGCSKKSRPGDRSSVYVVSTSSDEATVRPPTTLNHVAPAAVQHTVSDRQPPTRRSVASGTEHVERYVVGGGTAVTVSVRHQQRHQHDKSDNDVTLRQPSNYEPVLDEYLYAAMATQDANTSNHSGKVHADAVSQHL